MPLSEPSREKDEFWSSDIPVTQLMELANQEVQPHASAPRLVTDEQLDHLTSLLSQSVKKSKQLELEVEHCHAAIAELQASYDAKSKELDKFILAGGALGGETRDRIIRTLQEQLQVREEEVNYYKSERMGSEEDQRRDERLLISAVHSIALRYHDEMVRTFDVDINDSHSAQELEEVDKAVVAQTLPQVESVVSPTSGKLSANHFQIRETFPLDIVN